MKIIIYIESLRTFTSGMPHRGVLIELIKLRKNDFFTLVLRKNKLEDHMKELINNLSLYNNWELKYEKTPKKIVNLLALIKYKKHCRISYKGDFYLSFDCEYLFNDDNQKSISTIHDLSSVRSDATSSIRRLARIARKFTIVNGLKNSSHIVSISNFTKKDVLNYINLDKNKISVIHNGIDSSWFEGNEESNVPIQNYMIWWGGFSERKNLLNLLKAYENILEKEEGKEIPNILFIGNHSEYKDKLLNYIKGSKYLEKKVFFESQKELEELKQYISNSKGLLFPSLYEGFGLPVIEAFSQGIPVLTSNVTSLPEIASDMATFIDPNSIISIETSLKKFIHSTKIESSTLKEYAKKFTYYDAAKKYSKIIDEINK